MLAAGHRGLCGCHSRRARPPAAARPQDQLDHTSGQGSLVGPALCWGQEEAYRRAAVGGGFWQRRQRGCGAPAGPGRTGRTGGFNVKPEAREDFRGDRLPPRHGRAAAGETGVGPAQGWEPRPTLGATKSSQTTLPGAGSAPALLQRRGAESSLSQSSPISHPSPLPRPPAQCRGSLSDLRGVHLCGVHSGSGCLGRKGRQGRRGAGPRALRPGLAAVSCPLTSMRIL